MSKVVPSTEVKLHEVSVRCTSSVLTKSLFTMLVDKSVDADPVSIINLSPDH